MNRVLVDRVVMPWLALMGDWSLRWGVVLAVLLTWLAVRPPRRAAARHAACIAALVAGLLLPLSPRWGAGLVPSTAGARAVDLPARPPAASQPAIGRMPVHAAPPRLAQAAPVSRLDDPAPPVPEPAAQVSAFLDPRRAAALGAAAVWVSVIALLLLRFAGGQVMVRRLRRNAVSLDGGACVLLHECCAALGLARFVVLATHRAVVSPIATGGGRPMVLVPPDWETWPESDRRACLLHELAHLARRDDWMKLFQELVAIPFFYHPLVRWLLLRLDRERELLCDETVVASGIDRVAYARLLLRLAGGSGRVRWSALSAAGGGLPFLERRTAATRITRLLGDDLPHLPERSNIARGRVLAGLVLVSALGLGGVRIQTVGADDRPATQAKPVLVANPPAEPEARLVEGRILDPAGEPVGGAVVVAGLDDTAEPDTQVLHTDANGRFTWLLPEGDVTGYFVAFKEGLAPAIVMSHFRREHGGDNVERKLQPLAPFSAQLVDEQGRGVAAARVRVEMFATASYTANSHGGSLMTGYQYIRHAVLRGSPLERLFETTTGPDGSFTLNACGPEWWLKFDVTTDDGKRFRVRADGKPHGQIIASMSDSGFVAAPSGAPAKLVAVPSARVSGRVVTQVPGVSVAGLTASYQPSRERGDPRMPANFGARVQTDASGHFGFESLAVGTINVFVHGDGENDTWTYRAGQDVALAAGKTSEVVIELIRGVEVEGSVVAQGTRTPVENARVGVYGPFRPRSGPMTTGAVTDESGHFRYRLPAGETYFYMMNPPSGYTTLPNGGSTRTVTIPEDAARFEVPPITLAGALSVHGRVLDAGGVPVVGATVVGICQGGRCTPLPGSQAHTFGDGSFWLPTGWNNTVAAGQVAHLLIRLRDGTEHEAAALPAADGTVNVKLALLQRRPEPAPTPRARKPVEVEGPKTVAPDEIAGVVVDAEGRPIAGASVEPSYWVPNHPAATSDAEGRFRVARLGAGYSYGVRVRREGYAIREYPSRPTGEAGWVIVLENGTYFEGRVSTPDGAPVADALVRVDGGAVVGRGSRTTESLTETRTDARGRYRMYVLPGQYDFAIRATGVGVAGLGGEPIGTDQHRTLDFRLTRGNDFVVRVVDTATGKGVESVKLAHWLRPEIAGTSDAAGTIRIRDVPPGRYPRFEVEAKGYVRWWSDDCLSEWARYQKASRHGFQRNFDGLDFEIRPNMGPVTVQLERGATVRGRVTDPDGKPVAGATVAPALTGTGNSLTGDTRFSAHTDEIGRFEVVLPASGDRAYNLVAHDGTHRQWRTWANGVSATMRTTPGQVIENFELRLTRPATVTGRVVDAEGRPVAGCDVRASAGDRMENRYYDPTTTTGDDGAFTLRFIRPGEQFIQASPFWLDATRAPDGTTRAVVLKAGETMTGVELFGRIDRGR